MSVVTGPNQTLWTELSYPDQEHVSGGVNEVNFSFGFSNLNPVTNPPAPPGLTVLLFQPTEITRPLLNIGVDFGQTNLLSNIFASILAGGVDVQVGPL